MKLTKEQVELLVDLSGQIQGEYGLVIGYANPQMPISPIREADFIIFDDVELNDLYCFHRNDIKIKFVGQLMVSVIPEQPEHDDQVEELIVRINKDLLDGKIWFDPGIIREIDGLKIEVTKKSFPGEEDVFSTNIFTEKFGTIYTYAFISEAAPQDKRFKIAKQIIDEIWPHSFKTVGKEEEKELVPKSSTSILPAILSQILKMFGI